MSRTLPALVAFLVSCVALIGGLLRAAPDVAQPRVITTEGMSDEQVHGALCAQCHPLVDPRSYRKEEWPAKVDEMRVLSAERGLTWTDEQHAALQRYMGRHGR